MYTIFKKKVTPNFSGRQPATLKFGYKVLMDINGYIQQSTRSSQTLADAIAEGLRQAILAGALPDGKVLRQAELASQFGVSRVPIREALLKLQKDGLVEARPRRGTVVTSLDADDFQEILEMRLSLESLALKLAIPHMGPDVLAAASLILDEAEASMTRAASGAQETKSEFETRWGELNWAFHRSLYVASGRSRLMDTIENLHLLFARHLRMRLDIVAPALLSSAAGSGARNTNEWSEVLQEHRQILSACESKDVRLARSLLERHITQHGDELVRRLRDAQTKALLISD
jgi:DNA-binding GntR family transcriptional regulator